MPATALTATDTLLKRNAELSKDLSAKSFTLTPDLHALVLTCADHRVDPAQVLGLSSARLSCCATRAAECQIEGLETGFELILMHHTDCGLARLDGPGSTGGTELYICIRICYKRILHGPRTTDPTARRGDP